MSRRARRRRSPDPIIGYPTLTPLTGQTGNWRADRGRTTVTGVSQWDSIFPVGLSFTQADTTMQPVYVKADANFNGKSVLYFDGSNDRLIGVALSNYISAAAGTVLMVCRPETGTGTTDYFWIANSSSNNTGSQMAGTTTTVRSNNKDAGTIDSTAGITITLDTVIKLEWRHEGGNVYCRVGATEVSLASGDTSAAQLALIFQLAGSTTNNIYIPMRLAELVTLNTAISAGDRVIWDAYCLATYGV